MNMTIMNTTILAAETVAILKDVQQLLNRPAFNPTPMEALKAELIGTLRELIADNELLTFILRATEVQISLSAEQKKAIDAAIVDIQTMKKTEKRPAMIKSLDAAYWRTMKTRKSLLTEIDGLFTEKRRFAAGILSNQAFIDGIKAIINTPYLLASGAAEVSSLNN